MNATRPASHLLHLSVAPGVKSWSILVGIISIGLGATYYSPGEHILLKAAYLIGCLVLGLTFLDDWEDCVFDKAQGKVTLTRYNWCQRLFGSWFTGNSLELDMSSVMAVRVLPTQTRLSKTHQVVLMLRAGGTVAVAETCQGSRNDQETLASKIQSFLQLDRVETVRSRYEESSESEDDESFMIYQMPVEVECLKGSGNMDYEDIKIDDENGAEQEGSDSDTSEVLVDL
ncbi:cytochrome b-245 chaperone 1 homolog [Portunus trituberculatus]|uniref:cytochrome b-245 chaperone 1 homolog n=1 Tax=Portunus trituberculatus TaxID=210409 RepID=UPI001E1CDDB7|nr:cytochrome b-245 chaperone 1 homolog [Portunus trituberculatus]